MDAGLKEVRPLPDYRLEMVFHNGSIATVNLRGRMKTLKFSRLASPELFARARAEGLSLNAMILNLLNFALGARTMKDEAATLIENARDRLRLLTGGVPQPYGFDANNIAK